MMSLHSSTHSSQMNTVGPAISLRTSCCDLPQKRAVERALAVAAAEFRHTPSLSTARCRSAMLARLSTINPAALTVLPIVARICTAAIDSWRRAKATFNACRAAVSPARTAASLASAHFRSGLCSKTSSTRPNSLRLVGLEELVAVHRLLDLVERLAGVLGVELVHPRGGCAGFRGPGSRCPRPCPGRRPRAGGP